MNRSRNHAVVPLRYAALLMLLAAAVFIPVASAQTQVLAPRYFSETGHYSRGAFRSFWERNGGLPLFGYPITEEYTRKSDGKIVQYYERARLELRVQNNQAIVELGLLGVEITGNKIFPKTPPFNSTATRRYFPETGHSLQGAFKRLWDTRGTAIFGLPISEEISEQLADGKFRTVQYFERARFELWPSGVQLGLFGRALAPPQLLESWPANVAPTGPLNEDGTPRPPNAPAQPPATQATLRATPISGAAGTQFAITGEGYAANERISVWLTAPDGVVRAVDTQISADRNGSLGGAGLTIATDAGFKAGRWLVSAQGLNSKRLGVAAFEVRPSAPPPGPSRLGVALLDEYAVRGNGSIQPLAAPPGYAFTFRAGGFNSGEQVSVWRTRPDTGGVEPVDQRLVQNDGAGNVVVVFGTDSYTEGRWTITAQGVASGRSVTVPFKLTHDYVAPLGTPRPAIRNGTVAPAEGGQRAVFQLTGTGFRDDEVVAHWITGPDGVYVVQTPLRADRNGRIGYTPGLQVQFGSANPTGVYGYHYIGTRSGARVDLYMTFTGAP